MGSKRDDVDLILVLTDPVAARKYIAGYDFNLPPDLRPDHIYIKDTGRVIRFENISDYDAVVAALAILREREIPMAMQEKEEVEKRGHIQ